MEANSPSLGKCFEIGRTLDRHSLGKGYAWEISKVINQQTASSFCPSPHLFVSKSKAPTKR